MVIELCSSYVNILPSRPYLDISWGRIDQTISAHRLKDNHTRYIGRCSVSLDFNDTANELDGWCLPKSAVCGLHADNAIDTLILFMERGRVHYKVRLGTGKRLCKANSKRFWEARRATARSGVIKSTTKVLIGRCSMIDEVGISMKKGIG